MLETAFNYLQQGDIEINYDGFKAFCALILKRKVELHSIAKQKQIRIDSQLFYYIHILLFVN